MHLRMQAEEEAKLQTYFATEDGSVMKKWLLYIGVDADELNNVVTRFQEPEFGIRTLKLLFALEDGDIDELLKIFPLGNRRLLKKSIKQEIEGC